MNRIRAIPFLTALGCAIALAGPVSALEVESDSVYCFSPEDFSPEEAITGICITDLPQDKGSVMLGTRILRAGDILTADQVSQMTFAPVRTETDQSVQVGYLPIFSDRVEGNVTMTIGIRGKEDLPPVAEDSAVETYKNIPAKGNVKATDPEGQPMTYTVTRAPKRGNVVLREDGSFTYTPKKNKIGVDSFTFTAADPAGNVSREATITITVLKPTEAPQYTDTLGKECQFAAEWMKHTGIFIGETLGDKTCFSPERQVTRGEFVTMLVKALDIPTDEDLVYTGYTDEIPQWLQPYLAAAMRAGVTAGLKEQQVFGADEPVTGAEAAVMLCSALKLEKEALGQEEEATPVWGQDALTALAGRGITLDGDSPVTRGVAAQVLYLASKLNQA